MIGMSSLVNPYRQMPTVTVFFDFGILPISTHDHCPYAARTLCPSGAIPTGSAASGKQVVICRNRTALPQSSSRQTAADLRQINMSHVCSFEYPFVSDIRTSKNLGLPVTLDLISRQSVSPYLYTVRASDAG